MHLILISREDYFEGEGRLINELLECGTFNFHIRKKTGTEKELRELLKYVHPEFSSRIVLHQEFHLAKEFQLKGLHLPESQQSNYAELSKEGFEMISTSIHRITDFNLLKENFSYLFYSPVYPSISKSGYTPLLSLNELKRNIHELSGINKLIALGGINQQNFKETITVGFGGLALLGAVWQNSNPKKYLQEFITAFNAASKK